MAGRDLFATEQPNQGRDLFAEGQPPAGAEPTVDMKMAQMIQAYQAGEGLNPRQRELVEELNRRKNLGLKWGQTYRQEAMQELAQDTGWLGALGVGFGKGLYDVGRGVGLADEADPTEKEAFAALEEEHPVSTTIGEIGGQVAPFLPAGVAAGGIASLPIRAAASGVLGATEGGILADDTGEGALVGGGIGLGAEILFPVIGRLGRKVLQRVTGKTTGAVLDAAGRPTSEMQKALDASGMSFDDLVQDAQEVIAKQKPGAKPEQVARASRAAQEGIPLSKGELTRGFKQQASEQQLLVSPEGSAAEPFRQFKLAQSQKVKSRLEDLFPDAPGKTEMGEKFQAVLEGRKKVLRSQKNELYQTAAENAKNAGDIPIMPDGMVEAIPDSRTMRRLEILDPTGSKQLDNWLMEYGVIDPTEEMIEKGFDPVPLTLETFEEFRMGLNQIADSSDAIKVATGPLRRALDEEGATVVEYLEGKGLPDNVLAPLKEARKTVRELKTEFSPESLIGKLTGVKKDGVTMVTDASEVYDKLVRKSVSPEDVGKAVRTLSKSEGGKEATQGLQATVTMDLLDAGFSTESRKISGQNVFNPIAFRKRMDAIGKEKLAKIFADNKTALRRLTNIEAIAKDLIPENIAVPKGSAASPMFWGLFERLAMGKVPVVGPLVAGTAKSITEPVKKGLAAKTAMRAEPEVVKMRTLIDRQFPALASAMGIAITTGQEEQQ